MEHLHKWQGWRPGDYTDKRSIRSKLYATPDRYSLRGEILSRYSSGEPGEILKIGLNLLDLQPHELYIDIGTGTGFFANLVYDLMKAPVYALDLSFGQVAAGKLRNEYICWLVADAECLPLPDNCFDAASANFMLYHLSNPKAGLQEIARILRNQGKLLVLTKGHNTYAEMDSWYRKALAEMGLIDNGHRDEARLSERNMVEMLPTSMRIDRQVKLETWVEFPDIDTFLSYFASTPRYHYYVSEAGWEKMLGYVAKYAKIDGLRTRKIEWAFLIVVSK